MENKNIVKESAAKVEKGKKNGRQERNGLYWHLCYKEGEKV